MLRSEPSSYMHNVKQTGEQSEDPAETQRRRGAEGNLVEQRGSIKALGKLAEQIC